MLYWLQLGVQSVWEAPALHLTGLSQSQVVYLMDEGGWLYGYLGRSPGEQEVVCEPSGSLPCTESSFGGAPGDHTCLNF